MDPAGIRAKEALADASAVAASSSPSPLTPKFARIIEAMAVTLEKVAANKLFCDDGQSSSLRSTCQVLATLAKGDLACARGSSVATVSGVDGSDAAPSAHDAIMELPEELRLLDSDSESPTKRYRLRGSGGDEASSFSAPTTPVSLAPGVASNPHIVRDRCNTPRRDDLSSAGISDTSVSGSSPFTVVSFSDAVVHVDPPPQDGCRDADIQASVDITVDSSGSSDDGSSGAVVPSSCPSGPSPVKAPPSQKDRLSAHDGQSSRSSSGRRKPKKKR